ncbi:MAG: hypothetical protein IPJ41_09915 [Phycisphaerales bacterium]|nr:hypothetical protein [Phycisphaerales bacterium]
MSNRNIRISLGLVAAAGGIAGAQPVIDGTIAGDGYGSALSVQKVQTQFGDNLSELDAAYARVQGGMLYLALTGNIENNFNKIDIYFDSVAGGENVLSGAPGNDNSGAMSGLTFDAGFEADYHLILRRGFDGSTNRFDLDYSVLGTASFSSYGNVFGGTQEGSGSTGTGANAFPIALAYDNSNLGGVSGGDQASDQSAALAVETGVELAISLADLGLPASAIKVLAFINNQNHDYASNQFLGSLEPPQGNLGGDGFGNFTGTETFNLNDFAGDQWFRVAVPAPGALPLLALGGLAALRRRR